MNKRVWLLLAALLLVASSARAQTFHEAWSGTGTGTPQVANISVSGFTANDLIVVGARLTSETATVAITDNGSVPMDGTWACVGPTDHSSAGQSLRSYLCYALATSGNPSTLTVTASAGSVGLQVGVGRASGNATVDVLDQSATGETAAGTTTHNVTSAPTTTQANELLIGWIITATAASFTAGSPPTYQIPTGGTTSGASLQYAVVTATGAYGSPFTTADTESSVVTLATFKAASGGGGGAACTGAGLLLGVGGC